MSEKVVTLDVRDEIRCGKEPFAKIMQTVSRLKEHESLLLIAPFEPVPLYGVLAGYGFDHDGQPTAEGDWEVKFRRHRPDAGSSRKTSAASKSSRSPTVVEVDARGLEPPQPLVVILEKLASLPEGAELQAHTDRRPMHLYGQLEKRGFNGVSQEQPDGSFVTRIRRR
ncbi:MAG: DUF2249 domain-containing protein [Chloroflexi bacterium]|nr:DUF2249 domain-containing protein [Chloroflexota bacterium]